MTGHSAPSTRPSQLPLGYKQTEVGVIPEDWEVKQLSHLIEHDPKNGYSGRSAKDARGTLTLSLAATTSGQMILNSETVKTLETLIPITSPLYLKEGDVLVQRSNTPDLVGMTAIFNGPSSTYIYPDLMMRLRFKEQITGEWFWRIANSSQGRRYFVGVAAGSTGTMPKISGRSLSSMPIPLPPTLAEQEAIAEALSDADALIDSLEQLIAKKRLIKRGAMQELLTGKRRLPGFSGEWEVKRLGEVAVADWGNTSITKESYNDYGYPAYSAAGQDGFVSWFEHEGTGVVLSAIGAQCGKTWLACDRWTAIKNTIWFKAVEREATTEFLFWQTGDRDFWPRSGQAQPFVSVASVRQALVSLPPSLSEQTAIASILSDMDAEIVALEERLEKARQIKQGMMQELLTGRVRLVRNATITPNSAQNPVSIHR